MERELIRRRQYLADPEPGLLSFVTSAWNTPIEYLSILAESIIQQDFGTGGTFEWVIVDNGSTREDTRAYLHSLAEHPFIRLVRTEQNQGIIGGTRLAVQHARGRYVLPVDSDDYVYPDAARIMAHVIQQRRYPTLLYSDEDKLTGARFEEPYLKPDWDPVLFVHSCYIAHLCAIDRGMAIALGAYTDPEVSGCHDWDTFIRFMINGFEPVHVPHVLYSWRKHAESTAANIDSKDYIHSSHRKALGRFVATRKCSRHFQMAYSPFFQRTPDWWFQRLPGKSRSIVSILIGDTAQADPGVRKLTPEDAVGCLTEALRDIHPGSLVRFRDDDLIMDRQDWPWEAQGALELFDDVVAVGGPVFTPEGVVSAGAVYFGFGSDGLGMPDRWRPRNDPGYFAQMWKPHTVNAMTAQNLVVWSEFLFDALASGLVDLQAPISMLGEWLGAVAHRWGVRVVFSPFLGGVSRQDWQAKRNPDLADTLLKRHSAVILGDNPWYSPRLNLVEGCGYQFADPHERESHFTMLASRTGVPAML
jgi:glycosyltransferase involved in cell wall biosynthesis